jgi:hypothetical protein
MLVGGRADESQETKQAQLGNRVRFNDFVQADRSLVPPPINKRSHENELFDGP